MIEDKEIEKVLNRFIEIKGESDKNEIIVAETRERVCNQYKGRIDIQRIEKMLGFIALQILKANKEDRADGYLAEIPQKMKYFEEEGELKYRRWKCHKKHSMYLIGSIEHDQIFPAEFRLALIKIRDIMEQNINTRWDRSVYKEEIIHQYPYVKKIYKLRYGDPEILEAEQIELKITGEVNIRIKVIAKDNYQYDLSELIYTPEVTQKALELIDIAQGIARDQHAKAEAITQQCLELLKKDYCAYVAAFGV